MIITRINNYLRDFPPSERKIALYILDHPEEVTRMSVNEVAEKAESSTSAIIRLCKKIDVDGFRSLKLLLVEELATQKSTPFFLADRNLDDEHSIIEKIIKTVQNDLDSLPLLLRADQLKKAATAICSARHVMLFGIGASHLVAMDFAQKLLKIGIFAPHPCDQDEMAITANRATEDDVCIFFSYSGETPIIHTTCQLAKKRNAKIVAVTRYGNSPLASGADILLSISNSEPLKRQGATASRISQLVVVDALYSTLLINMNETESMIKESYRVTKPRVDEQNQEA